MICWMKTTGLHWKCSFVLIPQTCRLSEISVSHGEVGVTFRTGQNLQARLGITLLISNHGLQSPVNPNLYHPSLLLPRAPAVGMLEVQVRSLSSHGFWMELSCMLTWPISLTHQKCHCSGPDLFLFFWFVAISFFTVILKNRALNRSGDGFHMTQLPEPKKDTKGQLRPGVFPFSCTEAGGWCRKFSSLKERRS